MKFFRCTIIDTDNNGWRVYRSASIPVEKIGMILNGYDEDHGETVALLRVIGLGEFLVSAMTREQVENALKALHE